MSGAVDWQPLLEKTIIALVSPLGTAWFLGLLAVLLAAWGRRRLAAFMGVLALAWLGVWSLPVASHTLRGAIEAQHPLLVMDAVPRAQAIVVLGGGVLPARHKGQPPDLQEAADRLTHGARLFRAGKAPLLVLSGGSNRAVSATSEAEAMRQLLLEWGVPAQAMVLEERSRNTRENARFTAEILRSRGIRHILLVTSALHMPRARALFEAQGLMVTPAATDHEARSRFTAADWLPDAQALHGSARAFKELLGRATGY